MRSDSHARTLCPRLKADRERRYPAPEASTAAAGHHPEDPELDVRLHKLPPEIGTLLIIVGIAGVLLPGPVGTPFVIAGGFSLWPSMLGRVDDWFRFRFPGMHRKGMKQVSRFLSDLEGRYPGSAA